MKTKRAIQVWVFTAVSVLASCVAPVGTQYPGEKIVNTPALPSGDLPVGLPDGWRSGPRANVVIGDSELGYNLTPSTPAGDSYEVFWAEGQMDTVEAVKASSRAAGAGHGTIPAASSGVIPDLTNGQIYSVVVTAHNAELGDLDSEVYQEIPLAGESIWKDFTLALTPGDKKMDYTLTTLGIYPETHEAYWIKGTDVTTIKTVNLPVSGTGFSGTIPSLTNGTEYSVVVTVMRTGGYPDKDSTTASATLPEGYSYPAPVPVTVNGVTATVTFSPASPRLTGTVVTATVNFSGAATARATFSANLTSVKAGLNGAARTKGAAKGAAPAAETFTFTVPAGDVDDFALPLSFAPWYRQSNAEVGIPTGSISPSASIKRTFGIVDAPSSRADEEAAFTAVQAYLTGKTPAQVAGEGVIQLGDYIDLDILKLLRPGTKLIPAPASLFDHVANIPISTWYNSPPPYPEYEGASLRIIVVGVNSFNTRDQGNANAHPTYSGAGANTGGKAHLVFQFQNAIAFGNMTHTLTYVYNTLFIPGSSERAAYYADLLAVTTGGWATSTLRAYLNATGPANSFLDALVSAGIPSAVLFDLSRKVSLSNTSSTDATTQELSDKVWLPTELQMLPVRAFSALGETEINQARLEYYDDRTKRIKTWFVDTGGNVLQNPPSSPTGIANARFRYAPYWTASPGRSLLTDPGWFAEISGVGEASYARADVATGQGIAPAFVIRGN